jgi:hypothetical protein
MGLFGFFKKRKRLDDDLDDDKLEIVDPEDSLSPDDGDTGDSGDSGD